MQSFHFWAADIRLSGWTEQNCSFVMTRANPQRLQSARTATLQSLIQSLTLFLSLLRMWRLLPNFPQTEKSSLPPTQKTHWIYSTVLMQRHISRLMRKRLLNPFKILCLI